MCVGATAVGGGFYTEYTLPTLATNFNCSGKEARLYQCQFEKMPGTNCIHDAAVICQGNSTVFSCCNLMLRLSALTRSVVPCIMFCGTN